MRTSSITLSKQSPSYGSNISPAHTPLRIESPKADSVYFPNVPPFKLETVIFSTEILHKPYSPDFSELNPAFKDRPVQTYEFQQLETDTPLMNNSHDAFAKCLGVACYFIEHMANTYKDGVEFATQLYHSTLVLKPRPKMELKAAILSCCGARRYKYNNDDKAIMPMIHGAAFKRMEEYHANYRLLFDNFERVGFLRCYHHNFSEQIHKALMIMNENSMEQLLILLSVPEHALAICIFRCKPEEGNGYWIIPNDANEAPFFPLKVSDEDIKNKRLQFNNLLQNWIHPLVDNVPMVIPMDCFVEIGAKEPKKWYMSYLSFDLNGAHKSNDQLFVYILSLFVASLNSSDEKLAYFAIDAYKNLPPELQDLFDITNRNLDGKRSIMQDGKRIFKENWGVFFVVWACSLKNHGLASIFLDMLKINVNTLSAPHKDNVGKDILTEQDLTTPLIAAIHKKDTIMVETLLNEYGADPLYPDSKPAYKSCIGSPEIAQLLINKCHKLKMGPERRLILTP